MKSILESIVNKRKLVELLHIIIKYIEVIAGDGQVDHISLECNTLRFAFDNLPELTSLRAFTELHNHLIFPNNTNKQTNVEDKVVSLLENKVYANDDADLFALLKEIIWASTISPEELMEYVLTIRDSLEDADDCFEDMTMTPHATVLTQLVAERRADIKKAQDFADALIISKPIYITHYCQLRDFVKLHVLPGAKPDIEITDEGYKQIELITEELQKRLNYVSLTWAVKSKDTRRLEKILGLGADTNQEDQMGYAPIHHAAMAGNADGIEILISKGSANLNHQQHGWTPLHFAANFGHYEAVEKLLELGAEANVTTVKKLTAYDLAMHKGHVDIAELINRARNS